MLRPAVAKKRARRQGQAWVSARACLLPCLVSLACTGPRHEQVDHGRFKAIELSVPKAPHSVALLLAAPGDGPQATAVTAQLSSQGSVVARIDASAFIDVLDAAKDPCASPSGDLDNLARFIQAYLNLPSYQPAILLGVGVGAGLVSGALEQSPGTFAGAIIDDDCGPSPLHAPLCPAEVSHAATGAAPEPPAPLRLRPSPGGICPEGASASGAPPALNMALLAGEYAELAQAANARATYAPTDLGDMPIVEVLANGAEVSDAFGVFLSGDGGWAGLDKELSARLAQRGLPIVGIDSLRYFWRERTPESTAADLDRVIQRYQAAWGRKRVVLLGFSQGADVLPFVLNRLPPPTRGSLVSAVTMAISTTATFEFHVSNWMGASGDRPTLPEMERLAHAGVVCIYGKEDGDSLCPRLDPNAFRVVELPGTHHFNGDYDRLSTTVLATLPPG